MILQADSVDGGNVCTYSSILLFAMLILQRRQLNTDNESITMVCPFIWVWKYIRLIFSYSP